MKLDLCLFFTSFWAKSVLSPLGRCSSSPRTTQLAMMVSNTVYSKGGHSMRNLVVRRMKFFSLRMKSEEGPELWPESPGPPPPDPPEPAPRELPRPPKKKPLIPPMLPNA